jgi:hypothetical protein
MDRNVAGYLWIEGALVEQDSCDTLSNFPDLRNTRRKHKNVARFAVQVHVDDCLDDLFNQAIGRDCLFQVVDVHRIRPTSDFHHFRAREEVAKAANVDRS